LLQTGLASIGDEIFVVEVQRGDQLVRLVDVRPQQGGAQVLAESLELLRVLEDAVHEDQVTQRRLQGRVQRRHGLPEEAGDVVHAQAEAHQHEIRLAGGELGQGRGRPVEEAVAVEEVREQVAQTLRLQLGVEHPGGGPLGVGQADGADQHDLDQRVGVQQHLQLGLQGVEGHRQVRHYHQRERVVVVDRLLVRVELPRRTVLRGDFLAFLGHLRVLQQAAAGGVEVVGEAVGLGHVLVALREDRVIAQRGILFLGAHQAAIDLEAVEHAVRHDDAAVQVQQLVRGLVREEQIEVRRVRDDRLQVQRAVQGIHALHRLGAGEFLRGTGGAAPRHGLDRGGGLERTGQAARRELLTLRLLGLALLLLLGHLRLRLVQVLQGPLAALGGPGRQQGGLLLLRVGRVHLGGQGQRAGLALALLALLLLGHGHVIVVVPLVGLGLVDVQGDALQDLRVLLGRVELGALLVLEEVPGPRLLLELFLQHHLWRGVLSQGVLLVEGAGDAGLEVLERQEVLAHAADQLQHVLPDRIRHADAELGQAIDQILDGDEEVLLLVEVSEEILDLLALPVRLHQQREELLIHPLGRGPLSAELLVAEHLLDLEAIGLDLDGGVLGVQEDALLVRVQAEPALHVVHFQLHGLHPARLDREVVRGRLSGIRPLNVSRDGSGEIVGSDGLARGCV
jgi:hypothetical protein